MREVTKQLISDLKIKKLGYDEMGFTFNNIKQLSFHHLIIPKRECQDIDSKGYLYWNGAILRQNTSHKYLHTIEFFDRDMFNAITNKLIDINVQKAILYQNLVYINDVLEQFEREYCGKRNRNGNPIIKEEYIYTRVLKKGNYK